MLEVRGLTMSAESPIRVLIVEDEDEIRNLIVDQFRESGIGAEGLSNGREVLIKMETFKPDVVLLDQMMPGKSGKDIIREIRGNSRYADIPIMMVTGLNSEEEKVAALELGADDYVTKPFSMREVIARSQALVRRAKQAHKSQQKMMTVGELTVDLSAHKVVLRGVEVQLTLTEFKILVELLRQSGQVLTRDRLRERALGNLNVTDRTIDVHMASLRKKLDSMGDSIETVRGVGYRMAL